MGEAKTTVVIVSYLSKATIDEALRPLAQAVVSASARCVVVDNASSDGTSAYVRDAYPWVEVIDAATNLGFGRGCNLGAHGAKTEYLLFLNPDASITPPELQKLTAFMDSHPQVGLCGPSVADQPQRAGMLMRPRELFRNFLRLPCFEESRLLVPGDAPFRTSWICGACMCVRRNVFELLNGFDPRFFLYFEETDLCLRTMQLGYEIWAVPESVCRHMLGVSAKAVDEPRHNGNLHSHFFRSRFYYLAKHHGPYVAVAADVADVAHLAARTLLLQGESTREGWAELRLRVANAFRSPE